MLGFSPVSFLGFCPALRESGFQGSCVSCSSQSPCLSCWSTGLGTQARFKTLSCLVRKGLGAVLGLISLPGLHTALE